MLVPHINRARARPKRRCLIVSVIVACAALLLIYLAQYLMVDLPSPTFTVHTHGVVVITGASSGIGLSAAISLASRGYTVFAGIRKEKHRAILSSACNNVRNSLSTFEHIIPIMIDVRKRETIDASVITVSLWMNRHNQPLAALINNAGIAVYAPAEMTTLEQYEKGQSFGVVGSHSEVHFRSFHATYFSSSSQSRI